MRPHETESRRRADNELIARVGFSPWTNIAHLAGTSVIMVAVIGFGGQMYSAVHGLFQSRDAQQSQIDRSQLTIARHDRELSAFDARLQSQEKQIERVERRAANDRLRILGRLNGLSVKLDELNSYLREQRGDGR